MAGEHATYNVRAAERVLRILGLFKEPNSGFTLTEISMQTGLNKSTALRLLSTLRDNDFLKYNEESKKYTLGLMLFMLGSAAFESLDLRKIARPYLREASNNTNLISHLGILDGEHVIIIDKIWPEDKMNFIKMVSEVGGVVPAHCTGVGKVLLSGKSDEYIYTMFKDKEFEIFSDSTIKNVEELLTNINEVRKQGFAVNNGEHEPYIRCITYPIYDVKGNIAAALSLTGLFEEYKGNETLVHEVLQKTTTNISHQLGYHNTPLG